MAEFTITGDVDPFLHVSLRRGESVLAESNAMVMMDATLEMEGDLGRGGVMGALARGLANQESFFLQKITAARGDGDVLLAASFPGGIHVFEVGPRQYHLADGAFLACGASVTVRSAMQGAGRALFAGTGGFLVMQSEGWGPLAVAGTGSLFLLEVKRGSPVLVDNAHVVAWETTLEHELTTPQSGNQGFLGRMVNSATSGEFLVLRFSGEGQVLLSSRNKQTLAQWLLAHANRG